MRLAVIVALCLASCAAPAPGRVDPVLSPDAELSARTTAWAKRWSAATGRSIVVGPGGTPVEARDEAIHPITGEATCGYQRVWRKSKRRLIVVDITPPRGCPDASVTLGHEMGHELGAKVDLTAKEHRHSLMYAWAKSTSIDEMALTLVCEHFECLAFNPEID